MLLLNGKTEETLEALRKLLLSEYESKAYFALLMLGESKAIDIVRVSGVPQAKIYSVLEDLQEKKLVEQTQAKPIKVKAVQLGVALEQFKSERIVEVRKAMSATKFLQDVLDSLQDVKEKYGGQFRVFELSNRRSWKGG